MWQFNYPYAKNINNSSIEREAQCPVARIKYSITWKPRLLTNKKNIAKIERNAFRSNATFKGTVNKVKSFSWHFRPDISVRLSAFPKKMLFCVYFAINPAAWGLREFSERRTVGWKALQHTDDRVSISIPFFTKRASCIGNKIGRMCFLCVRVHYWYTGFVRY